MAKHNQDGVISGLGLALILMTLVLVGTAYFAFWAYSSRQDYKNNTDKKIAAAVTVAVNKNTDALNASFAQAEKYPLTAYTAPVADGSVHVLYPKTWSGLVDTTGGGDMLDAYFAPGLLPPINDSSSIFSLTINLLNQPYSQAVQQVQGAKGATITAYSLPKLPNIIGIEVSNYVVGNITKTEVILPLRSYSLVISTYGTQYLNDFNTNILPNLTFSP
ncbi:MAG TPA: hypothetical protein VFN51_01090 [Candidatus Saccharimonadales bacterium]|nr:hypothetical protein [Candidatus Saccharimonadales bacterium]